MARSFIVGPIASDLLAIDFSGRSVVLATAFYSRGLLRQIAGQPSELEIICRLNISTTDEWKAGVVAPDALLEMLRRFERGGTAVRLFVSPLAHAKCYVGAAAGLVGSANLSVRGFGGGDEIVQRLEARSDVTALRAALQDYKRTFQPLSLAALERYVSEHRSVLRRTRRRRQPLEDRLPSTRRDAIPRLGNYSDFLTWLDAQVESAAGEIAARARGKGQLSGHIFRNFYGVRQYLIANADELTRFAGESPDYYKLSRDQRTEARIAEFVSMYAVDETDFSLDTWKTYLPQECGGRAGKHGGTIGNLNRMLPLVARYLTRRLRSS